VGQISYIKGMNTVLRRRIDPNEPLPDATALLTAARTILTARKAPITRKSNDRRARPFMRAGATSRFNRNLSKTFGRGVTAPGSQPVTHEADAVLMPRVRAGRRVHAPYVDRLRILQAANDKRLAKQMVDTLSVRRHFNLADESIRLRTTPDSVKHNFDTLRMTRTIGRYGNTVYAPGM
jgi:hypothetical protein